MRNVIVTGGTKGLGLAIAGRLAGAGDRVIAVARGRNDAFDAQAEALNAARPGCLHFRPFDLTQLDAIAALIQSVTQEHGPLYALVNNAGIGTPGLLATMPEHQIAALLHLNIAAPIAVTKYAVRAMMAAGGGGAIVNIGSIVASTGYSGLSVYAATRAALAGFTRSLARELGPLGITVNCVAPGFIDTDMTSDMTAADKARIAARSALRRMADAADVAGAVQYLLSDQARNITAITLTVDAGNTA